MSHSEIRNALAPIRELTLPFVSRKRKSVARAIPFPILHFHIGYQQWDGPPLTFNEDFGKKKGQVYSRDHDEPVRSCNEVEVAKRLRRIRDNAFWISSYNPSRIPELWRPWTCGPQEIPDWLRRMDGVIRRITGRATGGIPDVVAWNDVDGARSALLIECKGAKEDFGEGQEDWVTAALQNGLSQEQLAVAIRQFV